MNGERDFDQLLRTWLDDGADVAPERFVSAALGKVERTPQRGSWRASLEGLLMRLQPAAPILGIAAVAIAAIALYAAFARPNTGGPDSSATPIPTAALPAATAATGEYATSRFATPIDLSLPAAASAEGWLITDTASLLRVAGDASNPSQLIVLDPAQTRIVEEDGTPRALPNDLAGWLDDQPGVDAQLGGNADVGGTRTYDVAGQPTQVFVVTFDADAAGRTLLQTTEGFAVAPLNDSTEWWLMPFRSDQAELLVIYGFSNEEQSFGGSFIGMAESIRFR